MELFSGFGRKDRKPIHRADEIAALDEKGREHLVQVLFDKIDETGEEYRTQVTHHFLDIAEIEFLRIEGYGEEADRAVALGMVRPEKMH